MKLFLFSQHFSRWDLLTASLAAGIAIKYGILPMIGFVLAMVVISTAMADSP